MLLPQLSFFLFYDRMKESLIQKRKTVNYQRYKRIYHHGFLDLQVFPVFTNFGSGEEMEGMKLIISMK